MDSNDLVEFDSRGRWRMKPGWLGRLPKANVSCCKVVDVVPCDAECKLDVVWIPVVSTEAELDALGLKLEAADGS